MVLGTGPISLNAPDNDEKIEISKIVPSAYGDADAKITSPLELPEVLRRLANLGTGYPEVVADTRDGRPPEELAWPTGCRRGTQRQHPVPGSDPG